MPATANRTRGPFERGEEWGPTNATAPETMGRQCFWGTSHTSVLRLSWPYFAARVPSGAASWLAARILNAGLSMMPCSSAEKR